MTNTMTDSATRELDALERQQQLEQRIDKLRSQRLVVARRHREAEMARAGAAADMEEAVARAEAQRQMLRAPLEAAERRSTAASDRSERDRAEIAWRKAHEALAAFEAEHGEHTARSRRAYADLDAQVAAFSSEATELDRQSGAIADELARLVGDHNARRTEELEARLAELAPLVDAQREAVGITATADLSADYTQQADGQARAWKWWGAALIVSVAMAIAGGLILFREDSVPKGDLTNGTVVEVVRNLVIVSLLIYVVRLASLQFRVHRHLEAVARNKSAALSTFNRMVVVATEPEIRNSLATVLAQSVFSSDETGFVDAGGDHVTLIERVAGSVSRPS